MAELLAVAWKWSPLLAVKVLLRTRTVTLAVFEAVTRSPSLPMELLLLTVLPVTTRESSVPLLLRTTMLSSPDPVIVELKTPSVPRRFTKLTPTSFTAFPFPDTVDDLSRKPLTVAPLIPLAPPACTIMFVSDTPFTEVSKTPSPLELSEAVARCPISVVHADGSRTRYTYNRSGSTAHAAPKIQKRAGRAGRQKAVPSAKAAAACENAEAIREPSWWLTRGVSVL